MAQTKKQNSAKPKSSDTNVTRIKAVDDAKPVTKKASNKSKSATTTGDKKQKRKKPAVSGILRPFIALGAYFKGAWYELKQVRWPTRAATWSLTGAVIAYSLAFTVLIVLLDLGFKQLFELAIG